MEYILFENYSFFFKFLIKSFNFSLFVDNIKHGFF